jgi:hypothetical protein
VHREKLRSTDFQSAVSPTSKSAAWWRLDGPRIWKPAILIDLEVWLRLAKPQPKERGVYAASTLGVRQPVKLEEGLESWKESKFILQMNLQDWRLFPVGAISLMDFVLTLLL